MSASANADNDAPVPCENNCGFWGRPSTGNFCSSCYKQKVGHLKTEDKELKIVLKQVDTKKTDTEKNIQDTNEKQVDVSKTEADAVVSNGDEEKDAPVEPVRVVQKNKMRCFSCRKKVGLTGTECRCGYVYCSTHRYPEEHECDFDFQALAQEKVAKKTGGAIVDKIQGEKL